MYTAYVVLICTITFSELISGEVICFRRGANFLLINKVD